ncbi:MAG: hypothetical protein NTW21_37150 [Verrucomicrobia bacterium]|nr:hypothetical protein [Verrucomicrobiota bacterium]
MKLRQVARILLAIAVLTGIVILGVVMRRSSNTKQAVAQQWQDQLNRLVEVKHAPVPKYDGKPNRQAPAHDPVGDLPEIPENPSDQQVGGSRVFPTCLWPIDGAEASPQGKDRDNAEVGRLLRRFREADSHTAFAELKEWLDRNPGSRWFPALKHEYASYRFGRGYFVEARQQWDELWASLKDTKTLPAHWLGNEVLARMLDANIGAARLDRLRELIAETEDRSVTGALEGKIFRAKEAVWLLEHTVAQNVMCGPLALNAIKDHQGDRSWTRPKLSEVSKEHMATGIPLTQVLQFSKENYGLDMQMARRTGGTAPIPTPAVMHVSNDHFCSLLEESPDGASYFLEDRTLNFAGWVDAQAVGDMASGYFLVASASLPDGWKAVDEAEGRNVFGKNDAHGIVPPGETVPPESPTTGGQCPTGGMPTYTFHPMPGALRMQDRPLGYSPPVGPSVFFKLNYNDMDDSAPTSPPTFAHVGLTWSTDWVAWIEHVSGTLTSSSQVRVHVPGGGLETAVYDTAAGRFKPNHLSFATVTRSGTATYTRDLPDGSRQVFNAPDNPTTPVRVFMTRWFDPQGNSLTFAYDSNLRLVSVADALGQVTTLQYNDPANIYRITSVTDPFSRAASLQYDAAGRLRSITDVINLTTALTYASDGFISTMVTPYGTTRFAKLQDVAGSIRALEVTDPGGHKERVEFNDAGGTVQPNLRSLPPVVLVGGERVVFYSEDARLSYRNSYYWSKHAMREKPGDPSVARNYRWFSDLNWQVMPVIEAIKEPLEDRVWFNYPGGVASASGWPAYPGQGAKPEKSVRVLANASAQATQSYYNALGNPIKHVDPLGRTTEYTYEANGVDLREVRQTTGGISERLAATTYNAQHLPLTATDAAGQTTQYAYNARGQVRTVTNQKNEVTTLNYDENGYTGYLTSVDGPLPGNADTTRLTYDGVGRIRTVTESDGYVLTYDYDAMDRRTAIRHPDGTATLFAYDRLDLAVVADRLGRMTQHVYNANRQLIRVTDALNRVVQYDWCSCGALESITDPMERVTRWQYDVQGRVTAKQYADRSRVSYLYDETTSLLRRKIDEKGQFTDYMYNLDGTLRQVSYPNATIATPSVSYTYDPLYPRVKTMVDGIGTITYAYHPVTATPTLGAGKLASVDGPWANDTITYNYDSLGREETIAINGVNQTVTFDAAGRATTLISALGSFGINYVGSTGRIDSLSYPNNQMVRYDYFPTSGDRRLQRIRNLKPDGAPLSAFEYTYDANGSIQTWSQQQDSDTPRIWTIGADAADQLTSVTVKQGAATVKSYGYSYDHSGNRLTQNIDGVTTNYAYNIVNQLTDASPALPASTYEWDAENRLVAINNGSQRSEFGYDGRGRRVRITEKQNGATTSDKRFLWNGLQLCEERDATGATVAKRFLPLGVNVTIGATAGNYFYTTDHLGSVRELADATGAVRARYGYDPYGQQGKLGGDLDADLAYTGHLLHAVSGLHLAPYRAYAASFGRWMSRDPIGEGAGLNLYAYVLNSSILRTDPLGLKDDPSSPCWENKCEEEYQSCLSRVRQRREGLLWEVQQRHDAEVALIEQIYAWAKSATCSKLPEGSPGRDTCEALAKGGKKLLKDKILHLDLKADMAKALIYEMWGYWVFDCWIFKDDCERKR